MTKNPFTQDLAGQTIDLPRSERFEASHHIWSQPELNALALAHAARRPLLVRGEPGSGKSQLARAAAVLLQAPAPLVQVIHPRFEPRDLLYRYDTIRRLADANAGEMRAEREYVQHGALWQAWQAAGEGPVVVLVDEIDKGDADVPNSLLEILGQRSFRVDEVPGMDTPALPPDAMPLVVITTNEERELPAAFVRRCVVLNLNPPKHAPELKDWLWQRVQAHTGVMARLSPTVVGRALDQVLADRQDAERLGYPKVGLAEALDLLTALAEITQDVPNAERETAQNDWLDRISAYALVKHADTHPGQLRPPVKPADGTGA
ncbi:MAG: AAA family ATPase [Lysobacteraceae bacterium]|nr:MAG: AAA family ATPase [Xanthomonadaceae bacterium]